MFGNDAITGGIQTKTDDCFPAVVDEDEETDCFKPSDINSMSRNEIDT